VLNGRRLYLRRYWQQHVLLDTWLAKETLEPLTLPQSSLDVLSTQLKLIFATAQVQAGADIAENPKPEIDWQVVAAAQALVQKLSLVTGGPGTGKTSTAAKIVFLLALNSLLASKALGSSRVINTPVVNIRLLAPTGKAAARLASAIAGQIEPLCSLSSLDAEILAHIKASVPERGETIHRFLYEAGAGQHGAIKQRQSRSDAVLIGRARAPKVALDIVVVDESSMIDINLMTQLVSVLPAEARIVMLGDHYQLPPVEPGDVFGTWVRRFESQQYSLTQAQSIAALTADQCLELQVSSGLESSQQLKPSCLLRRTYRFGGDLMRLAECIKSGNFVDFAKIFPTVDVNATSDDVIQWFDLQAADSEQLSRSFDRCIAHYSEYFSLAKNNANVAELAQAFDRFQILCSTYDGPLGVDQLNLRVEQVFDSQQELYHGKAILVTKNHPAISVFNGDIGFVVSNEGAYDIHFPLPEGGVKRISPLRLHHWQPAYAMTVHKSQGSEYQHISVFVADYAKELLSRPLLYTAVTRSKAMCELWVSAEAMERVLASP